MSTNLQKQKRITRLIRVPEELHKKIKAESVDIEVTMSKLLEKIISDYLKNNP